MAFERSGLCRVGGSGVGAATWQYSTTEATTAPAGTNYFLPAINELELGDVVIIVGTTGSTPTVRISYVKTKSATSIDLAGGLVVTA